MPIFHLAICDASEWRLVTENFLKGEKNESKNRKCVYIS